MLNFGVVVVAADDNFEVAVIEFGSAFPFAFLAVRCAHVMIVCHPWLAVWYRMSAA